MLFLHVIFSYISLFRFLFLQNKDDILLRARGSTYFIYTEASLMK